MFLSDETLRTTRGGGDDRRRGVIRASHRSIVLERCQRRIIELSEYLVIANRADKIRSRVFDALDDDQMPLLRNRAIV